MIRTDIVISSTDAPHYVIKKKDILTIMPLRRHRPIFFIDIAVPRDIEPEVNDIDNVYLYNIDDLETVSEENLKRRQEEIERCLPIIERETAEFMKWLSSLEVTPTIRALRQRAEEVWERAGTKFAPAGKILRGRERGSVFPGSASASGTSASSDHLFKETGRQGRRIPLYRYRA